MPRFSGEGGSSRTGAAEGNASSLALEVVMSKKPLISFLKLGFCPNWVGYSSNFVETDPLLGMLMHFRNVDAFLLNADFISVHLFSQLTIAETFLHRVKDRGLSSCSSLTPSDVWMAGCVCCDAASALCAGASRTEPLQVSLADSGSDGCVWPLLRGRAGQGLRFTLCADFCTGHPSCGSADFSPSA